MSTKFCNVIRSGFGKPACLIFLIKFCGLADCSTTSSTHLHLWIALAIPKINWLPFFSAEMGFHQHSKKRWRSCVGFLSLLPCFNFYFNFFLQIHGLWLHLGQGCGRVFSQTQGRCPQIWRVVGCVLQSQGFCPQILQGVFFNWVAVPFWSFEVSIRIYEIVNGKKFFSFK